MFFFLFGNIFGKCWWSRAERRRASAENQARKLFEGAEREVRQLRLACIHPQMTAYWRNLSAEMQLDSVRHSVVSIFNKRTTGYNLHDQQGVTGHM